MKGKSLLILHMFIIIAASVSLLCSCARMGNPDGGLYDETPPKIVKTSPKNGDTNAKPKKIVLEFDEIVKLDNAQSVVVSPPQMEMPEVEANGRKVTVELLDTLKPNTTYTIDFGNSISDNNEGNPFGDYAFTFSTGAEIDTFQCSGYVLDASNLEPIKDILVGLYRVDSISDDSIFYKRAFERISHTDGSGHFVIKGLNQKASYRVYALKDQDQDYKFSQKAEMIGFNPVTFTPSCKPDLRPDTIWHDSLHFEKIDFKAYTHFYPDNLTLLAFTEDGQNRQMLKKERPTLQKFSYFFTAPDDSLPIITGLNFDAKDAFIIDACPTKDTIDYWIRDSLVYNMDTLKFMIQYNYTDTLGQLTLFTDSLVELTSKISLEKTRKLQAEKYQEYVKEYKKEHKDEIKALKKEMKEQGKKVTDEDILVDIPPMPEEFMDLKYNNTSSLDPDKNIDITFPEPLDSIYEDKIHLSLKVDSVLHPQKFLIKRLPNKLLTYRIYGEWIPDSAYVLNIDTGAFVSIYGNRNEGVKRTIKIKSLSSFSTLFLTLQNADTSAVVQLLNGQDKPVKTVKAVDGKADFYFITPNTYYLRMFYDRNGNGKWDTGDYASGMQAEEMYYFPKEMVFKADWEFKETWNPTATEIFKQKHKKITKQKPDKEKTIKNRNAEKLAEMAKRKAKK